MFNFFSSRKPAPKNKIKFHLDFAKDNSAEAVIVATDDEFTKYGITNFHIKATAKLTAPSKYVKESPTLVFDVEILLAAPNLVFFTDDNNKFLAFRGDDNVAIKLSIDLLHAGSALPIMRTSCGNGMHALFYHCGKLKKPLTLDGVITIETE